MKTHMPLATVMHHCRASLVAGILAMDTRGIQLSPTSFKEAGALNPHNMARICAFMAGKKATLAGMKQLCSQYRQREMFEWHVYHHDPRSHEFVHSSRRMPPLFAPSAHSVCSTSATRRGPLLPLTPPVSGNEATIQYLLKNLRRSDVSVNTGQWKWSEGEPAPGWDALQRAALWVGVEDRQANAREVLRRPVPNPNVTLDPDMKCCTLQVGHDEVRCFDASVSGHAPAEVGNLPFCALVFDVPVGFGLQGDQVHTLVIRHLAKGTPLILWGEHNDIRTADAQIKEAMQLERIQVVDILAFDMSRQSDLFTMGRKRLTITRFHKEVPKVSPAPPKCLVSA